MDNFSKRNGYTQQIPLQLHSVSDDIRVRLWNVFYQHLGTRHNMSTGWTEFCNYDTTKLFKYIWLNIWKKPVDEMPKNAKRKIEELKSYYFSCQWNKLYDLLEIIASTFENSEADIFCVNCNYILQQENAGYRMAGNTIAPIVDPAEIESIENSLEIPSLASKHISKALKHLSDKINRDPKNSIKESISAIECILREKLNKPSVELSGLLDELKIKKVLHPAFILSIDKLYGYTSDAPGIRHSEKEGGIDSGYEDALCMLIISSAFVNRISSINL